MSSVMIPMARNVAPSGLPTWRSFIWGEEGASSRRVVFSLNNWVTAMPIEAKEREVRSQARKVRSVGVLVWAYYLKSVNS